MQLQLEQTHAHTHTHRQLYSIPRAAYASWQNKLVNLSHTIPTLDINSSISRTSTGVSLLIAKAKPPSSVALVVDSGSGCIRAWIQKVVSLVNSSRIYSPQPLNVNLAPSRLVR